MLSVHAVKPIGQVVPHLLIAQLGLPVVQPIDPPPSIGGPPSGFPVPGGIPLASAIGHFVVQPPQWSGSALRSKQPPPSPAHLVVGGSHAALHIPPAQT